LVGLSVNVFEEGVNHLFLVSINQPKEISNSFLSPPRASTITSGLRFGGMCGSIAFNALRQFNRCFRSFTIYRGISNPNSIGHLFNLHPGTNNRTKKIHCQEENESWKK